MRRMQAGNGETEATEKGRVSRSRYPAFGFMQSGVLCQQRHDVGGDQAACSADDVAHQSHQDADGHQSAAVGTGQNGCGGGAADIGQRSHAAGEHVEVEDLGQQHQNDAVDGKDHEAGKDPCGGVGQLQEACAGGQQGHHGVQQQVGQLGAAGHAAHGGHSADQACQRDEQHGPGGFIQERHCAVEGRADVLTECGDHKAQTQQEDQVDEGRLVLVGLGVFFQTAGHFVQRGGVGLDPLVELGRKVDGPQQEHDPDGVIDGVHDQRIGHVAFTDIQRSLHGDHVAGTAHPAAAQSAQSLPGVSAQSTLHDGKGGNEAHRNGEGGCKEAAQHLGAELDDLADVAAQQHQEDHGVQQVVLQHGVSRFGGLHVPDFQRAADHGDEVEQNDGRRVVEKL